MHEHSHTHTKTRMVAFAGPLQVKHLASTCAAQLPQRVCPHGTTATVTVMDSKQMGHSEWEGVVGVGGAGGAGGAEGVPTSRLAGKGSAFCLCSFSCRRLRERKPIAMRVSMSAALSHSERPRRQR